ARRSDAVNQAPVLQDGKIEAAPVPGDELRGVLLDAVEESPDQRRLALTCVSERPAAERILVAQGARDRDHALQMQRNEVAACPRAALAERELRDVAIGDPLVDPVQQAQARYVRHRLDVECEEWRHSKRLSPRFSVREDACGKVTIAAVA